MLETAQSLRGDEPKNVFCPTGTHEALTARPCIAMLAALAQLHHRVGLCRVVCGTCTLRILHARLHGAAQAAMVSDWWRTTASYCCHAASESLSQGESREYWDPLQTGRRIDTESPGGGELRSQPVGGYESAEKT